MKSNIMGYVSIAGFILVISVALFSLHKHDTAVEEDRVKCLDLCQDKGYELLSFSREPLRCVCNTATVRFEVE